MKYLKLLLIPMITFMFMVPAKAVNEIPDWAQGDYHYVIVSNIYNDNLTAYVFNSVHSVEVFNNTVSVKQSDIVYKLQLRQNGWVDYNGGTIREKDGVEYWLLTFLNSDSFTFEYSSFDIKNGNDLLFPKTPVISLAIAQQMALESLETEVQGASGRILAVGGVILGAILVTHLISRSRLWVKV